MQWVIWCGHLAVKFTPWPIRHGLHDGDLSSSGAVNSLQAGLPSNAKLERYLSRRPCPGNMPKPYPFWASVTPLCINVQGKEQWRQRAPLFHTLADSCPSCKRYWSPAYQHYVVLVASIPAYQHYGLVGGTGHQHTSI